MAQGDPRRLAIADRLRKAREMAGLSQGQVAQKLGLHRPSISEMEAGRRRVSAEELAELADLYRVASSWLLDEDPISYEQQARIWFAARELTKLREEDREEVLEMFSALRGRAGNVETKPSRPGTAATSSKASERRRSLIADLTGGREYSRQERFELEMDALSRSFRRRQELLEGSLTASQVAELLGTSRQTPHDRVRSGTLLAILDRGALRFPAWQFDPEGPDGVIEGLPEVLRALDASPLAKLSWFVRPNQYLDGRTPLESLKGGEIELVQRTASTVGMS